MTRDPFLAADLLAGGAVLLLILALAWIAWVALDLRAQDRAAERRAGDRADWSADRRAL